MQGKEGKEKRERLTSHNMCFCKKDRGQGRKTSEGSCCTFQSLPSISGISNTHCVALPECSILCRKFYNFGENPVNIIIEKASSSISVLVIKLAAKDKFVYCCRH